jgi:hypothetical protein
MLGCFFDTLLCVSKLLVNSPHLPTLRESVAQRIDNLQRVRVPGIDQESPCLGVTLVAQTPSQEGQNDEDHPVEIINSEPFHRMDHLTRPGFTEGFRVSMIRPSLSSTSRRVFLNLLTSAFFCFYGKR